MNFYAFIVVFMSFLVFVDSFTFVIHKESSKKVAVLFKNSPDETLFSKLKNANWTKLYEITEKTYILKHNNRCKNLTEAVSYLRQTFRNKIAEIETVKDYTQIVDVHPSPTPSKLNPVCAPYYGMGVENAWSRGYTGKRVVVAVTDVGINTDLIDLSPNINALRHNFFDNTTDVTPEYIPYDNVKPMTDHGNRCASLIAAVKGNEVCSSGIAFNASVAPLKSFKYVCPTDKWYQCHANSSSDIQVRSLVYELQHIDIYSNSWGPSKAFFKVNLDEREAINKSATEGRRHLGSLLVFPVSAAGNELANNENTITVVAVGQNGTVPKNAAISSSVLTFGLHDGNNLTASSMVTTSFRKSQKAYCISSFKGVSAATAQVAGMLALALEANPNLTQSDVQDVIAYSSELNFLENSQDVKTNAAGRKFHSVFGFGLLNATKLVDLAKQTEEGLKFLPHDLSQVTSCFDEENNYIAEFCYNCTQTSIFTPGCLQQIKTAKILVTYTTQAKHVRMTLISPSRTESILLDLDSDDTKTDSERSQTLTSVHFWDEAPTGLWRFKLQSDGKTDVKEHVSLILFGKRIEGTNCSYETNNTNCATTCPAEPGATGPSGGLIAVIVAVPTAVVICIAITIFCIKIKNNKSEDSLNGEQYKPCIPQACNSKNNNNT